MEILGLHVFDAKPICELVKAIHKSIYNIAQQTGCAKQNSPTVPSDHPQRPWAKKVVKNFGSEKANFFLSGQNITLEVNQHFKNRGSFWKMINPY